MLNLAAHIAETITNRRLAHSDDTNLIPMAQWSCRELNLPPENESPLKRSPAPFRVLLLSARPLMVGGISRALLQVR
jgi:hypothetical protein